jgi:hypothetical protein
MDATLIIVVFAEWFRTTLMNNVLNNKKDGQKIVNVLF